MRQHQFFKRKIKANADLLNKNRRFSFFSVTSETAVGYI